MRLFVAINLPAAGRERVYEAAAALRDAALPVRWLEPESIHLTLKFLGDVPVSKVQRIGACLAQVAAKAVPFETKLRGFGAFPTPRRPRVIWIAAEAVSELRLLKLSLETELVGMGFEHEMRSFKPHVTLGRTRERGGGAGEFRGVETLMAELDYEEALPVRSIDLMQSHLSPEGARYEVVRSFPLGEPAEPGAET